MLGCFPRFSRNKRSPSQQSRYNDTYYQRFEESLEFDKYEMAKNYIDMISLEDLEPCERKWWKTRKSRSYERLKSTESNAIFTIIPPQYWSDQANRY